MIELIDPRAQAASRSLKPAIGIDLGTTYSLVGVVQHGIPDRVVILPDEQGNFLLPSAVWYASNPNQTWVGAQAQAAAFSGKEKAFVSLKRYMGQSARAVSVASDILRTLKNRAECFLKEEVTQAVITIPAYFDDAARAATKLAAEKAGLTVLRLLSEPTAAALAYGLDQAVRGLYVVYDLGGGTFDVSILRLEKGVFSVLATAGDTQLGGDDLDAALAEHLGEPLSTARRLKEELSRKPSVSWEAAGQGRVLERSVLERLAQPWIEKTLKLLRQALQDAQLTCSDIDDILLVGGSTRMPLIHQQVEAFFHKKPRADLDPDQIVCQGAAWQADALSGGSTKVLLLDVNPLSVGLEMMGGVVEKIIERNRPLPSVVTQEFTTYQEGQTGFVFHVVQGERELAKDCRSLARFELKGLPPLKAGQLKVKVTFQMDADGLLQIQAVDLKTGLAQQVIVQPRHDLDDELIEALLKESALYAREDVLARRLQERRVEAHQSLEHIKAAFSQEKEHLSLDEQKAIEEAMGVLERRLSQASDLKTIKEAIKTLEDLSEPFMLARLNRQMQAIVSGRRPEEFLS